MLVYWTNMDLAQLKRKNTCWETSTKVISDRLRRGHPGLRGELRSAEEICKKVIEPAAEYIYWWFTSDNTLLYGDDAHIYEQQIKLGIYT